jgi:hypothetical protein
MAQLTTKESNNFLYLVLSAILNLFSSGYLGIVAKYDFENAHRFLRH